MLLTQKINQTHEKLSSLSTYATKVKLAALKKAPHGSSKPSMTGVFSVCFPRQINTTDLLWPRMTFCAGRYTV